MKIKDFISQADQAFRGNPDEDPDNWTLGTKCKRCGHGWVMKKGKKIVRTACPYCSGEFKT